MTTDHHVIFSDFIRNEEYDKTWFDLEISRFPFSAQWGQTVWLSRFCLIERRVQVDFMEESPGELYTLTLWTEPLRSTFNNTSGWMGGKVGLNSSLLQATAII